MRAFTVVILCFVSMMFGAFVGVSWMCLVTAGRESDEREAAYLEELKKRTPADDQGGEEELPAESLPNEKG